jgi:hypothetical protein
MPTAPLLPGHACQIFRAEDLYVVSGVNHGDGLGPPEGVCAGDVYRLDPEAQPIRLVLEPGTSEQTQTVALGSELGRPGDPVRLVARYTLLSAEGGRIEALLLGHGPAFYALPLSPILRRADYTLIEADSTPVATRLSDLVCVSFARGTRIMLPTGRQRPIEALAPGDRVLTRDHGPQPVRWIGRATLRGVGAFAPVVIGKGALGNDSDLIVSQHHRMFLYRRGDRADPALPTAEVLVQAKHLVDGTTVVLREGGVIDYFSLVFDRHEIIYAEGIPAESLLVNDVTVARLPEEIAEPLLARFPGLRHDPHFGTEAGRDNRDLIETLRTPRRRNQPPIA